MTRAIALARTARNAQADIAPLLRSAVVTGCGLALMLAGRAFPF